VCWTTLIDIQWFLMSFVLVWCDNVIGDVTKS